MSMKDLEHRIEEGPLVIERGPGRSYRLTTSMVVHRDIHEVFEFFSDPHNLALITPRWLSLRVHSDNRIEMFRGTRIRYRFRVRGVPAIWRSEITAWEPPHRFVDEQRLGPFRRWVHEHVFEEDGGGTRPPTPSATPSREDAWCTGCSLRRTFGGYSPIATQS